MTYYIFAKVLKWSMPRFYEPKVAGLNETAGANAAYFQDINRTKWAYLKFRRADAANTTLNPSFINAE
jgi:hypothetical protein